jgi:hypothetical protein
MTKTNHEPLIYKTSQQTWTIYSLAGKSSHGIEFLLIPTQANTQQYSHTV